MEVIEILLIALIMCGAGAFVLWIGVEENKQRLAAAEKRQKNSIEWLRKERDAARLRNDIAWTEQQAELRPLILETKKAILQGKADKRVLDAVFARRALDDVLGMNTQQRDADPIEAAAAKILEEIENRRADGEDTGDLEELLRGLREKGGKTREKA